VKTTFFAIHDQVKTSEPDWGDGASGFVKRLSSSQAGNIIQNSLTALGNAAVGFEPRYDPCRCEGAWPRIHHAVVRNSSPTTVQTNRTCSAGRYRYASTAFKRSPVKRIVAPTMQSAVFLFDEETEPQSGGLRLRTRPYLPFDDAFRSTSINGCAAGGIGVWPCRTI
jgi:hypothetical protein